MTNIANKTNIGFGDTNFNFAVYIANKPNMMEYQSLCNVSSLVQGEIDSINQSCGNGWRKIFNVYAKLLYSLDNEYYCFSKSAPSWQQYRDHFLLQAKSKNALLFSPPNLITEDNLNRKIIHIISGKGHAKALLNSGEVIASLNWLDDEFAIDMKRRLIVCPYFDYRQLSNIKIERLAELLKAMKLA